MREVLVSRASSFYAKRTAVAGRKMAKLREPQGSTKTTTPVILSFDPPSVAAATIASAVF